MVLCFCLGQLDTPPPLHLFGCVVCVSSQPTPFPSTLLTIKLLDIKPACTEPIIFLKHKLNSFRILNCHGLSLVPVLFWCSVLCLLILWLYWSVSHCLVYLTCVLSHCLCLIICCLNLVLYWFPCLFLSSSKDPCFVLFCFVATWGTLWYMFEPQSDTDSSELWSKSKMY